MNYMNDCGSHVAELLVALKKFKDLPKVKDEKDLLAYYVKVKKAIEEDEKLKKETQDVLAALATGEKSLLKELEKIKKLSWNAFERNYALLDVKFDEIVWESTLTTRAKEIVEECLKKKIAFVDKETGAVVVELEKHGLPNTILLRSNKTTLYFTTDLALADYKWKKHEFDESVYFTASEQNLHFKQLFLTLKLLGRPYAEKLKHVGFGLVSLPEGKMSTRAGRVALLEDVLNQAVEAAREEVEKRQEYSKQDIEEIARGVGVAAIKFAVLRISPEKEITFNFKTMASFEGDTSAFVQYSLVRAKSILRKAKELDLALPKAKDLKQLEFNDAERALLASIAEFPLTACHAAVSLQPHLICDFLLKQCALFSSFYDSSPVLKAPTREEQAKRLAIVEAARVTFENGLRLLGIKTPEKM
jgi:arginyl-tRNA synthetase